MSDKPRNLERPWLKIVLDAEPNFFANRRREIEYEFTRRTFYADPDGRGAYGLKWDFSDEFTSEFLTMGAATWIANGFKD